MNMPRRPEAYIGLYTQDSDNPDIYTVQVRDTEGGHELPIPASQYINDGHRPYIDELPDVKDYKKEL
ncbi:hypothetical protein [Ruficoccus sp. ZRK36]|uniref:hypothetical protein n=1 Tax=Ruficoccus sp. ZRK36 TaxID=2866311 RepID=UPI001C734E61|nr:hypothetical protein [Ruficoccus sp. ZRK36]QYY35153.1 hypothetical protein K0V07_12710 [Ruficoccus sp. ZRK36]